jgi:hypothetical protein
MSASVTAEQQREVDKFLDDSKQREAAKTLGTRFFKEFPSDAEGRISSQVRNLQQMAVSATRFADIEDFIKSQMGRKTGAYKAWRAVGDDTLKQLEKLRDQAKTIATDQEPQHQLRLQLARGWVRAVVGAYLYEKALSEVTTSHG